MQIRYYILAALVLCSCSKSVGTFVRPSQGSDKPAQEEKTPDSQPEEPGDPGSQAGVKVGEVLPDWTAGCLDIHFINSARGECAFYILPDGTTMLFDAGESSFTSAAPMPNAETPAYKVYGNYIKHFFPEGHTVLDYACISHNHIDHMGHHALRAPGEGGYVHVGISAVYDEVKFAKLIDRGYPTYGDDPTIVAPDSNSMPNYLLFTKVNSGKFKRERFEVGSNYQLHLLYDPASYLTFKITNIVGNGRYIKKGSDGSPTIGTTKDPGEGNPNSCGFHLQYGEFDYISCGDLASAPQNRMAEYTAAFVGSLEAFKGNHHLNSNSWGSGMTATFKPKVTVGCCPGGPNQAIIEKAAAAGDVFITNRTTSCTDYSKCAGTDGHVVIRVAKGGGEYYVYMLDATNQDYKVKSIHGPYKSTK